MQSKAKSNSVITHALRNTAGLPADIGGASQIAFLVRDAGEAVLMLDKIHADIQRRAMLHGLIQRVSDNAAISRNPTTGKPATASEKLAAIAEMVEHLNSGTGEWRLKGGSGDRDSLLLRALCEVKPEKSQDELRTWLKERSAKERAALQSHAAIAVVMDRMRAESAQGIDADDLLKGL